jgi:hypothetical protein
MDDAEVFAAALTGRLGAADLCDPVHHLVGGELCASPLGVPMSLAPASVPETR